MLSKRLLAKAAEIFARPVRFAFYGAGVTALLAGVSINQAAAQHHWQAPQPAAACPCPEGSAATTPAPVAAGEGESTETAVPEPGSEIPEVADLGGDTGFASAGQSAAPTVIGDSISMSSFAVLSDGIASIGVPFNGGTQFKATVNQSAIPQNRVFYELNHHDSVFLGDDGGGGTESIDVTRHLFGFERTLGCCGCSSIQVQIPFQDTIGGDIDTGAIPPIPTDVRFGNISVAMKRIISQGCCRTWSAGLALDIPTADDTFIATPNADLILENEAFTLTPFLAMLDNSGGCLIGDWSQAFVSVDIPLSDHQLNVDFGATVVDVTPLTVLNLDYAVGKWLQQDCCGNGIAAVAELHYQTSLSNDEILASGAGDTLALNSMDVLNLTLGGQIYRGCWTITPAYVTPISSDELFDWEAVLHVNRRF